MRTYFIRRLLFFIPTLVIISLLAFVISVNAPVDPVEQLLTVNSGDAQSGKFSGEEEQRAYWRDKLGLNLPVFYITIRRYSLPYNLNEISNRKSRDIVERLSFMTGNGTGAMQLIAAINQFCDSVSAAYRGNRNSTELMTQLNYLKSTYDTAAIRKNLQQIEGELRNANDNTFQNKAEELKYMLSTFISQRMVWKNYIPLISFHGDNQYHRWIFGDGNWITGNGAVYSKGIVRGDFGISYQTRQPVTEVIGEKIGWSLFFSLAAVLLAYLVSIPLGLYTGFRLNSKFDRWTGVVVFLLYSMPVFWIATILLMTFANPDVLHWFPASGIKPAQGYPEGSGFFQKVFLSFPYIILPLICYTYGSFAFLSRTLRISMAETIRQDYIRTAYAKGLPVSVIITRHAFKNSALPLITVFANVFPVAFAGSVIIETIFTIPGMGYEIIQAIFNQNYPMIVAVFTISGFLTVTGYLISDILYAWADPRISFNKSINSK